MDVGAGHLAVLFTQQQGAGPVDQRFQMLSCRHFLLFLLHSSSLKRIRHVPVSSFQSWLIILNWPISAVLAT